jgi:cob(I)alamin adenosyltransferase
VALAKVDTVRPEVLRYLNRLSDLLFVLARYANHLAGVPDTPWRPTS